MGPPTRSVTEITAVIANYNYGRYLREAVDSALAEGAKVVVVDDGSTEPLPELPDEVELVEQENQGVAWARNAGIRLAETPYVIVLDADDRIVPGALSLLLEPLDADPELGFAYGRMRFFGDWEGELRFPPYDPYALLYRHTIGLSALVRRQVLEDTGGFDPAFGQFEDWELWVNALAHGWRGRQIDAVTVDYRRHSGSKHGVDRRAYRAAYRQLRAKHADLYRDAERLSADSSLSTGGRLVHRWFWGPRPVPASVEQRLYGLLWRRKDARADG
jgi:glycosyltransferase involved in cell wall biosynthesis